MITLLPTDYTRLAKNWQEPYPTADLIEHLIQHSRLPAQWYSPAQWPETLAWARIDPSHAQWLWLEWCALVMRTGRAPDWRSDHEITRAVTDLWGALPPGKGLLFLQSIITELDLVGGIKLAHNPVTLLPEIAFVRDTWAARNQRLASSQASILPINAWLASCPKNVSIKTWARLVLGPAPVDRKTWGGVWFYFRDTPFTEKQATDLAALILEEGLYNPFIGATPLSAQCLTLFSKVWPTLLARAPLSGALALSIANYYRNKPWPDDLLPLKPPGWDAHVTLAESLATNTQSFGQILQTLATAPPGNTPPDTPAIVPFAL